MKMNANCLGLKLEYIEVTLWIFLFGWFVKPYYCLENVTLIQCAGVDKRIGLWNVGLYANEKVVRVRTMKFAIDC